MHNDTRSLQGGVGALMEMLKSLPRRYFPPSSHPTLALAGSPQAQHHGVPVPVCYHSEAH